MDFETICREHIDSNTSIIMYWINEEGRVELTFTNDETEQEESFVIVGDKAVLRPKPQVLGVAGFEAFGGMGAR